MCKVIVLPILKPAIAFSPSSLLERPNIQQWGQELSAPNPLGQPCPARAWLARQVRCMWTTCTAPSHSCSHWLYRTSWINQLRSWPVQLCSLVSMMACTISRSTLNHSPSIWCLGNIGWPSTKISQNIFVLANISPSKFSERCVCKIVSRNF